MWQLSLCVYVWAEPKHFTSNAKKISILTLLESRHFVSFSTLCFFKKKCIEAYYVSNVTDFLRSQKQKRAYRRLRYVCTSVEHEIVTLVPCSRHISIPCIHSGAQKGARRKHVNKGSINTVCPLTCIYTASHTRAQAQITNCTLNPPKLQSPQHPRLLPWSTSSPQTPGLWVDTLVLSSSDLSQTRAEP